MRNLHPVGAHERPIEHGSYVGPDGEVETWTLHGLPGERHLVRVADARGALWHLSLDEAGRPERMQARLPAHDGRGRIDITITFFEDEALIWRRGAEPVSEAIALPPGYRLLWPPLAGRMLALGVPPGSRLPAGQDAVMTALIRLSTVDRGALRVRPVKFTVRGLPGDGESPDRVSWETPGLARPFVELDADGRDARWLEQPDGASEPVLLAERRIAQPR